MALLFLGMGCVQVFRFWDLQDLLPSNGIALSSELHLLAIKL